MPREKFYTDGQMEPEPALEIGWAPALVDIRGDKLFAADNLHDMKDLDRLIKALQRARRGMKSYVRTIR